MKDNTYKIQPTEMLDGERIKVFIMIHKGLVTSSIEKLEEEYNKWAKCKEIEIIDRKTNVSDSYLILLVFYRLYTEGD